MGFKVSDELDTRIDENLKASGVWEDVDIGDIFCRLEKHFGLICKLDDWREFFDLRNQMSIEEWEINVAPRFTFRRTCEFISRQKA